MTEKNKEEKVQAVKVRSRFDRGDLQFNHADTPAVEPVWEFVLDENSKSYVPKLVREVNVYEKIQEQADGSDLPALLSKLNTDDIIKSFKVDKSSVDEVDISNLPDTYTDAHNVVVKGTDPARLNLAEQELKKIDEVRLSSQNNKDEKKV